MFSFNVLCCRFSFMDQLIFSSSLRGALAHFRPYNSCTHSITKKRIQKTAGRYIQQSTQINNYLHLGIYLGYVLYCRFSFTDQLGFQLITRGGLARFRRYNSCTRSISKKLTKNYRQVHTIEHTQKQLCTLRYVLR